MRTLIVYTTKHGTTEKCVHMLLEKLTGKVDMHNLKSEIAPNLAQYDKVAIGGSIYILDSTFPKELLVNSVAIETFGGEFIFKNLNFIERLIVKKISKVNKDTSNISKNAIDRFAQLMNKA